MKGINIGTIRTEGLQSAVSTVKQKGIRSAKGIILLNTAALILELRKLIVKGLGMKLIKKQNIDATNRSKVAETLLKSF